MVRRVRYDGRLGDHVARLGGGVCRRVAAWNVATGHVSKIVRLRGSGAEVGVLGLANVLRE